MTRQALENGTWFNLDTATQFDEATTWNGNNHISLASGTQWNHERLYITAGGKWILNSWSQWQGSIETHEVIDPTKAYRWLSRNEHHDAIPETQFSALEL